MSKPEALNDKQEAPNDKQELPDPPPTVSAVPAPCQRRFPPRANTPAAPLPLLQRSHWRRLRHIFRSRAWLKYFQEIRLR